YDSLPSRRSDRAQRQSGVGAVYRRHRPLLSGRGQDYLGDALASQRLGSHEHIGDSTTLVLIVVSGRLTRADRQRYTGFANQLAWCFVHAYHRIGCIVGPPIHVEYVFHSRDELAIGFRWDYPTDTNSHID